MGLASPCGSVAPGTPLSFASSYQSPVQAVSAIGSPLVRLPRARSAPPGGRSGRLSSRGAPSRSGAAARSSSSHAPPGHVSDLVAPALPPSAAGGDLDLLSFQAEVTTAPSARSRRGPALAPPPPVLAAGQVWTLDPAAFKRTRKRMSPEQLSLLESHDSFQEYKRDKAASWLASTLPQSLVDHIVSGSSPLELVLSQVPDPDQRRLGLVSTFLFKAGPDGSSLGKARRALEELALFLPTAHLPASAILLNRLLVHVDARARSAAKGSQNGATVAASVRSGLITLAALGFPIEANHISVDAGAPPARKASRERRAGSLPILLYLSFEERSNRPEATFSRFLFRSLFLCWLMGRLRLVDVLRCTISMSGTDLDGTPVVCIFTRFSKDGAPLDIYFRAEGFLGPLHWVQEHVEALRGRPFSIPSFACPKGHAGDIRFATGWAAPARVASAPHVHKSIMLISSEAPLSLDADLWKKLGLRDHAGHGSPSDQVAVIGPHTIPGFAFFPVDEQELGHWRRRAQAADGELPLDPALQAALDRDSAPASSAGQPRPRPAAAPAAMSAEHASMRIRYTSGTNRQGRRTAQIRVHSRWVAAVRYALAQIEEPWQELRRLILEHGSDYSILHSLHSSPA
jgi:hypothetical protein